MNIPVRLPALGEAVESATISQWLKSTGDEVLEGEPIVEVSTDKVDTEVEAPATGVLIEIRRGLDSVAQVGDVIAMLAAGADHINRIGQVAITEGPKVGHVPGPHGTSDHMPAPALSASAPVTQPVHPSEPASLQAPSVDRASARTSRGLPVTEKTATQQSADDAGRGPASSLRGTTQTMTRLRKTIATRMLESLQASAQLTTIVEADVTEVSRLRRRHNLELTPGQGVKVSYLAFIAAAALAALRTYPQLNSRIDAEAGTIVYPASEHLGIAVDTPKGLFVPVIREAGTLTVSELAERISDVAARTREGSIRAEELTGGTFTITNTGSRGALMDTPIINQPQVAILGAGAVVRRTVILGEEGHDESIAVRSMIYLSLTYDHRVVDGADAARYLSEVRAHLEHGFFDI